VVGQFDVIIDIYQHGACEIFSSRVILIHFPILNDSSIVEVPPTSL
jgi:hypothetical protein